jgi:hypothetical protein
MPHRSPESVRRASWITLGEVARADGVAAPAGVGPGGAPPSIEGTGRTSPGGDGELNEATRADHSSDGVFRVYRLDCSGHDVVRSRCRR